MATKEREKTVMSSVSADSRDRLPEGVNLWENPPEATPAMKRAIRTFKARFKDEPWDGCFPC